jgi:hypothetical protein
MPTHPGRPEHHAAVSNVCSRHHTEFCRVRVRAAATAIAAARQKQREGTTAFPKELLPCLWPSRRRSRSPQERRPSPGLCKRSRRGKDLNGWRFVAQHLIDISAKFSQIGRTPVPYRHPDFIGADVAHNLCEIGCWCSLHRIVLAPHCAEYRILPARRPTAWFRYVKPVARDRGSDAKSFTLV